MPDSDPAGLFRAIAAHIDHGLPAPTVYPGTNTIRLELTSHEGVRDWLRALGMEQPIRIVEDHTYGGAGFPEDGLHGYRFVDVFCGKGCVDCRIPWAAA